jgi:hypothetical protein
LIALGHQLLRLYDRFLKSVRETSDSSVHLRANPSMKRELGMLDDQRPGELQGSGMITVGGKGKSETKVSADLVRGNIDGRIDDAAKALERIEHIAPEE